MMDDEAQMKDRQRRELIAACEGVASLALEAGENLTIRSYREALTALELIDAGLIPLRNGIGQWVDRVFCPNCRLIGRNLVAHRTGTFEGHGAIDIGFRCEHCHHEWGFEVLKDAEGS